LWRPDPPYFFLPPLNFFAFWTVRFFVRLFFLICKKNSNNFVFEAFIFIFGNSTFTYNTLIRFLLRKSKFENKMTIIGVWHIGHLIVFMFVLSRCLRCIDGSCLAVGHILIKYEPRTIWFWDLRCKVSLILFWMVFIFDITYMRSH